MKHTQNRESGFTLIELLVVIAIIALLSTIVLASMNDARLKAQDSKTIQQVREFQNAVALFMADNGRYPDPGTGNAVCIGPADAECYNFGDSVSVINPAQAPDFAFVEESKGYFSRSIMTAEAATVKNYLSYNMIDIPVVPVSVGSSFVQHGGGIIYKCQSPYVSGSCEDPMVYWATHKPVEKGTPIGGGSGSSSQIYRQIADDPGAGDGGGSYGY